MIVLGVDPGSVVAGWGLVRRDGSRLEHLAAGVLRPPRKAPFEQRLAFLHQGITAVIAENTPDTFAIESVFSHNNARSALQLGHARGIFLLAAAQASLEVYEYPPAAVKKAVTGDGAADKAQVRVMVERLLGITVTGPMDRSDALAVAICHAWAGPLMSKARALQSKPSEGRPRLRRRKG